MNSVGLLAKALIRDNPHDTLSLERKYLNFAYKHLHGEEPYCDTLRAVLYYDERLGRCPDSFESLKTFILSNPDKKQWLEKKAENLQQEIIELSEDEAIVPTDTQMLMELVYSEGHTKAVSNSQLLASQISLGAAQHPETKEKGPAAAEQYLRDIKEKIIVKGAKIVDGDFVENAAYISGVLDSYITDTDSKRISTGFDKIDAGILIGPRQRNRWIGILGYTNHGKSLYLCSLIYNMVRDGHTVLFVPREFSIDEAYMMFTFLHASNFPDLPMCSLNDWQKEGKSGNLNDIWRTKEVVIKDLLEGKTLAGKLIIKQLETWESIAEYMQAVSHKNKFDVLAIDYLTHLDVKGRDVVEEHKKNFRKAQMLTINGTNNDKSGLVIITPLQANKKAHDEAAKKEGDDYGKYDSLGAVDWYTQAAQDMDLIISVWFEGENLKEIDPPQLIVRCMKARGGVHFPAHRVVLNTKTGYISDINTMIRAGNAEDVAAGMTDEDINQMYGKTSKGEMWPGLGGSDES